MLLLLLPSSFVAAFGSLHNCYCCYFCIELSLVVVSKSFCERIVNIMETTISPVHACLNAYLLLIVVVFILLYCIVSSLIVLFRRCCLGCCGRSCCIIIAVAAAAVVVVLNFSGERVTL